MKSASFPGQIEPLEARIAPATILIGARGTAGTTNYDTAVGDPKIPVFFNTLNAAGSVDTTAIAANLTDPDTLANPNPLFDDTYYIKLKAGDSLVQIIPGAGQSTLLDVSKGTVVAFFVDANSNKQVDSGELSGISTGAGAGFTLNRDLDGSVISNYLDKTNKIEMTSLGGPKQSITEIVTGGSITGSIFAGGSISKVDIQGSVTGIFTGLAANAKTFDLLRGVSGGEGTLSATAAAKEAGGSITDVKVRAVGSIIAGDGGAGAKGGAVSKIRVQADSNGMIIKAGSGGAGLAGKAGGIGGDASDVVISGTSDSNIIADTIQILAGNGGATTGGKGGAGGKLSKVFVGFEMAGNGLPTPSPSVLGDIVQIAGGDGGNGKIAGAGGIVNTVKVLTQTIDQVAATYEISVRGGTGGQPIDPAGGAGGAGGAVSLVDVFLQDRNVAVAASVLIAGGDGGQTVVPNLNAKGALGGSVSTVNFVGFAAEIVGGKGASGASGGVGGSLTGLTFNPQETILANSIKLTAGQGGDASSKAAGKGGDIKAVRVIDSNLKTLAVTAGAGGIGTKNKGGDGGLVSGLDIIDSINGSGPAFNGEFILRSGAGGAGVKTAGKGGEISLVTFFSQDVGVNFASGIGGNATLQGKGGVGGKIRDVNVTADGLFNGVQVNGIVKAGAGGAGAGKGAGGLGGDVNLANINVDGSVFVEAGAGGAGAGVGGGGAGGNLIAVGAFGRDQTGTLLAGNAGTGGKAAKGGSIMGSKTQLVALRAEESLTIKAGNGASGGDGGNVSGLAFGSTFDGLSPTPSGNILIQAGDGSAGPKTAGKGGSVLTVSGNPSSGAGTTTQILAGKGADGVAKASDGGSVKDIVLSGVGDDRVDANTVNISIKAGHAGNVATAKAGAKGGDVTLISVSNLDPDTTLRNVAAGNGGASVGGKGGLGGTIDGVFAVGGLDLLTGARLNADIGYRTGFNYGIESMGGLFAGTGGAGAVPGLAGSVRNISADSIAAIVAGRDDAPQAVEKVEKISLNGLQSPALSRNSLFTISYPDGAGGFITTPPIDLTDPLAVQIALNDLAFPAPDNVIVTRDGTATFIITNSVNGNISDYTAEEFVDGAVVEQIPGLQDLRVEETIKGTLVSQESQFFKPLGSGEYTITFDGVPSNPLPFNATLAQVQGEITNLTAAVGFATVTGDAINGFTVKFVDNGDQSAFSVEASVREVQKIDVLGVGEFIISLNGNPTPRLPVGATNVMVKGAIETLLFGSTVTVTSDPADATSYIVTFDDIGDQDPFSVTEFAPLVRTTVDGTAATREVQTLSFVPRNTFTSSEFARANLVGAIVDPNEIGASTFKFTNFVGAPTFELGDKPIDGLIVAKFLDQNTINFTPEASLVNGVFFDHDNKI